jgi:hypothetical protein
MSTPDGRLINTGFYDLGDFDLELCDQLAGEEDDMDEPRIKTDKHYAISRRGKAVLKYVAAINGVWLVRKDGVIRKFNTRYAARLAAMAEIKKASA